MDLSRHPLRQPQSWVELDRTERPLLFVVVDTEEEFDWTAPFSRENVAVTAMRHIDRAQNILDRYGIKPTYVIDYCVASQPDGYEPLLPIVHDGRCTIGAHLHPWVTPPFEEKVSVRNSFALNLDVTLERAKIEQLQDEIQRAFGLRPVVYKAGRYGIGAETVPTIAALGFEVDTSVNPLMDFSDIGGPSFARFRPYPFVDANLLFLPCTVGFVGQLGQITGRWVHTAASSRVLAPLRAVGVVAKLGLVNKVMLSPEGNTLEEMRALATTLHAAGLRTFSLTFHSPSLVAGHTPYVATGAELEAFLECIDRFCEFFFAELHGIPGSPLEFRSALLEGMHQ
jgi:hypothetical protein